MAGVKLSKRLMKAAQCVEESRKLTGISADTYTVADVGCDHAYLAIYIVGQGTAGRCIASDVRQGPLKAAVEHIKEAGLEEKISTVLSDGVKQIELKQVDCLCILGMGGRLTARILEDGRESIRAICAMVLSPQSEPELVRACVAELGFHIESESTVYDEGKYYTIMTVLKGRESRAYAGHELRLGRALLKKDVDIEEDRLCAMLDRDKKVRDGLKGRSSESALESLRTIEAQIDELEKAMAELTEVRDART